MPNMRRLIINADDFGISPGVSAGIVELHQQGRVTSTSLMINLPSAAAAQEAVRGTTLDVGLHLNLTCGRPVLPPAEVPTLVQPDGTFPPRQVVLRRFLTGRFDYDAAEREWAAQIERFLAGGSPPSHLDSHHHLHAYPSLFTRVLKLARRYGVPAVRCPLPDPAFDLFVQQPVALAVGILGALARPRALATGLAVPKYFRGLALLDRTFTFPNLARLLHYLPQGTTELICHPGFPDAEVARLDNYVLVRRKEFDILASDSFGALLRNEAISLCSFADLRAVL